MGRFIWKVLAGIVLVFVVAGCNALFHQPVVSNIHLALGNPSNATASTSNPDNYLMEKPQYVISYNNSKHIPNWVSWELNQSWLGSVQRRNDFRPDDSLPQGWYQVVPSDYNNSGFDRGHMAPSADRSNSPENNSATFLMTNILPQAPDNNQGPWAELENYCRDLAKQGKGLYVISGGYGTKRTISKAKIVVPTNVWKVIVVLDKPGQGLQGISDKTRVIAVDMPNSQGIREKDWRTFRVSVDKIEAATGYDLLSNAPKDIQKTLQSKVDQQPN